MAPTLRPAVAADAGACGRIIYQAFKGIGDGHGFAPDFPSAAAATGLARAFIEHPAIYGVVAERAGKIVGSNFLREIDPIRAVGPISVDPSAQGGGVGQRLMQAVIDRGRSGAGVRLVQDSFNLVSMSLYASLGFEVKEPLMVVRGRPAKRPGRGYEVRPLTQDDVDACDALHQRVHGVSRRYELGAAVPTMQPWLVRRDGRVTGYAAAPTLWFANHGVAETEADMTTLLAGVAAKVEEPISFLVPIREAGLFRWCLDHGMRVVKPMNLMAMGMYQEPRGCHFPSVAY
jgi:GNAT superfamily N-acetyltransferase